jgi:hypothetical protein
MYTSTAHEFGLRFFLSSDLSRWTPHPQNSSSKAPSFDDVACRAYLNFQKHGSDDGHDLNDWLGAESELIAEQNIPAAS